MQKKITVGIVGGGYGKRVLLPVCLQHPRINVKWIATKHDSPIDIPVNLHKTIDWHDILSDSDIEAVLISTPHDIHAEQIEACLNAGKNVLSEKPLALNASDAIRLAELCDKTSLVGAINYNFRFIPQRHSFQSLLINGEIGSLKSLRLCFFRNDFDNWPSQWYYERKRGGGALLSTGSHLIDAIHWLTQSNICSINSSIEIENDIDVGFSTMMETDSGCTCFIEVSHRIPGAGKHTIEAHGDKGSLYLSNVGQILKVYSGNTHIYDEGLNTQMNSDKNIWKDNPRFLPTYKVIDLFVDRIFNISSFLEFDFWMAVKNQIVLDKILESHNTQSKVHILSHLLNS